MNIGTKASAFSSGLGTAASVADENYFSSLKGAANSSLKGATRNVEVGAVGPMQSVEENDNGGVGPADVVLDVKNQRASEVWEVARRSV